MRKIKFVLIAIYGLFLLFSCEEQNHEPSCSLTTPLQDSVILQGETITIYVIADDEDSNLKEVRFYIDNIGVYSINTFPYKYEWNTNEASVGSHTIKVEAIDDKNAKAESIITVSIISNQLNAEFIADETTIPKNNSVTFTDLSTGILSNWNWNFGDGSSSTEQYPVHKYTSDGGMYSVSLTVTNDFSSDTETKSLYITVQTKPTITTSGVLTYTSTTALLDGYIINNGFDDIIERGFYIGTSSNPETTGAKILIDSDAYNYTNTVTDLGINTTYYVKAFATNSIGESIGNSVSFTTKNGLPTVSTNNLNNIASTGVEVNSEITDNGDFLITSRGVCWSTSSNPSISDSYTVDSDGSGLFTSNISGLIEWTKYYVRAYAINENGTVYGNELSFLANNSVVDYDGNTYQTIKIGDQIWMSENLKTTHYSDGTIIQLIENEDLWITLGYHDKAMAYYDNSTVNANRYGALYTWAAAMNGIESSNSVPSGVKGACPDGWHLPSDDEWKLLEISLGMSLEDANKEGDDRGTNEASKLAGNFELWGDGLLKINPSFGSSVFDALPAGDRGYLGKFSMKKFGAFFWTTRAYEDSRSWHRNIGSARTQITRRKSMNDSGLSVRCIKD